MDKPRVAIFDFACCEGCQLQILNMEEDLLNLIGAIQPVEWREALSDHSETYDIAIIEGSITRPRDEERLREIRKRAGVLIALGACATIGGVNKLKNNFDPDEVQEYVYGDSADMRHLEATRVKAVDEVVPVEYHIHGCPINIHEFSYVVRCLLNGAEPVVPNYPVCVECKMRENVCRYEYDELCLGPITRAGCNAPCPSAGFWCFGCRGYVDDPNVDAASEIMDRYGLTIDDLKSKMLLFNSDQEQTNG